MLATLTACADDHTLGTPNGSFTVVVTATGTGSNAPTHTMNLTLVVQQKTGGNDGHYEAQYECEVATRRAITLGNNL